MPYISTDRVKQIREKIKSEFPGWKISVRREHYSTVVVTILTAPYNLLPERFSLNGERRMEKYFSPNEYHLFSTYQGQALVDLTRIKDLVNAGNGGFADGDYGFVPNWYFDLHIGDYEHPFQVERPFVKPKVENSNATPDELQSTVVDDKKIEVLEYSDKSFAVFGPTKHLKCYFALIGRPNFNLTHPITKQPTFGWIFSNSKKAEVAEILLANILSKIND